MLKDGFQINSLNKNDIFRYSTITFIFILTENEMKSLEPNKCRSKVNNFNKYKEIQSGNLLSALKVGTYVRSFSYGNFVAIFEINKPLAIISFLGVPAHPNSVIETATKIEPRIWGIQDLSSDSRHITFHEILYWKTNPLNRISNFVDGSSNSLPLVFDNLCYDLNWYNHSCIILLLVELWRFQGKVCSWSHQ